MNAAALCPDDLLIVSVTKPLDMRMRSIIISWHEHARQTRAAAKRLAGDGDPRPGAFQAAAGERRSPGRP